MKSIVELASRLDAAAVAPQSLKALALRAQAYLDADPARRSARLLRTVVNMVERAHRAINDDDTRIAVTAAMTALQAAWQAELLEGRTMIDGAVGAYRQAERARENQRAKSQANKAEWNAQARAIWGRRPNLSKVAVAREVQRRWPDYGIDHIARSITKPAL